MNNVCGCLYVCTFIASCGLWLLGESGNGPDLDLKEFKIAKLIDDDDILIV